MQAIGVKFWESGDTINCRLTIPLSIGGSIALHASITSAAVVKALRELGVTFTREEVGSLFGSIGKAVKKIGKISVLKKALSLGKALVNSPLANFIAPGISIAISGAAGAAKLIAASKGSDKNKAKKAQLALAAAKAQAQVEDQHGKPMPLPTAIQSRSPETRAAFRYLVTVNRAA
jgi:hypothetical protein